MVERVLDVHIELAQEYNRWTDLLVSTCWMCRGFVNFQVGQNEGCELREQVRVVRFEFTVYIHVCIEGTVCDSNSIRQP